MRTLLCSTAMALALGMAPALAETKAPMQTGATQSATTQAAADQLSQQDRDFATKAASGGMAEVSLGRLAMQNADSDAVREFGLKMVEDHGKANEKLKNLAEKKMIALPKQPKGEHAATRDRLDGLKGSQFDRQYADAMVKDHQSTIELFQREADEGQDADLKRFAESTLPTLKQHLKLAQDLDRKIKPMASGETKAGDAKTVSITSSSKDRDTATAAVATAATGARQTVDAKFGDMTANDLIGKDVVNASGDDIGEIEDVVIGADRAIQVVVGVGGFLGIGEKDVLVPLTDLSVGTDSAIMMSDTTVEALKARPKFEKDGFTGYERDRRLTD